MQKRALTSTIIAILLLTTISSAVVINEFTASPQTDWDNDGSISPSKDEFIELYNPSLEEINLSGWKIMIDDSPSGADASIQELSEIIQAQSYLTILKPEGGLNLNGQILLFNQSDDLIDSVTYGNWNDGNISDNAPTGSTNSPQDECIARIPNGIDTNQDNIDFAKTFCTFNSENGVLPDNNQGLNAIILAKIVLQILPRWLEFGPVEPGSINNPALNGPIILNATGSGADVDVEITEVLGYPFAEGLKINALPAIGSKWTVLQTEKVKEVFPTLDIPEDAQPGTVQGTIVYTVSGPTP